VRRRDFLLAAGVAAAVLRAQARLTPVDEAGYRKLLAAGRGKVLLVDFWATWCAPCRVELPLLVKLEAKYRARGLKLITVSCDEPEQEADALRFLQEVKVTLPAHIKRAADDDRFISSVDARWSGALPAVFLYDRQGRQAGAFVGESDKAAVEAAVVKLL
jgi:thiol-disulfide isomerase/thioredoxin